MTKKKQKEILKDSLLFMSNEEIIALVYEMIDNQDKKHMEMTVEVMKKEFSYAYNSSFEYNL